MSLTVWKDWFSQIRRPELRLSAAVIVPLLCSFTAVACMASERSARVRTETRVTLAPPSSEIAAPGYRIPDLTSPTPELPVTRALRLDQPLAPGTRVDEILVMKSNRKMYLLQDGQKIREFEIALGFTPVGHKREQGDGRTPEGRYFINYKNEHSQFHRSLKISYPDAVDSYKAQLSGENPGDNIMIHGLPSDDRRNVRAKHPDWDWTWGCVAVTNREIMEIWNTVQIGTPIEIRP